MPKEVIQHARINIRHVADDLLIKHEDGPDEVVAGAILDVPFSNQAIGRNDTLIESSSVSLHWSRDAEYVQVAIEAPRKWWDDVITAYNGSSELARWEVYSENLTRKEINDLIKTLRRARDAAYGVDE